MSPSLSLIGRRVCHAPLFYSGIHEFRHIVGVGFPRLCHRLAESSGVTLDALHVLDFDTDFFTGVDAEFFEPLFCRFHIFEL